MDILLVEDDKVSALILRKTLERLGHVVTLTGDGQAAWEILSSQPFKVIISDWMMPRLDGLGLCRLLRERGGDTYSYFVLLTSRDAKEDRLSAFCAGVDDFLTKPFNPGDLLAKIKVAERILGMHEQLRAHTVQLESLHEELRIQNSQLKDQWELERELSQSRKLQSIGMLAAGIAHEINTPMQYLGDNARFLAGAFDELAAYTKAVETVAREVPSSAQAEGRLKEIAQHTDVDYLRREIPRAIDQSLSGIDHVSTIVQALKEFSHPGTLEKCAVDINQAVLNTLTVASGQWRHVAEIETSLAPHIPAVPAFPGDLNQALLNVIVNAAQAIEDKGERPDPSKNLIRVETSFDETHVEVRISDTGIGIPEKNRERIFDPFFTSKQVGRGTGQGLSITYGVIVEKHGGTISFETTEGKGTDFIIRLPFDENRSPLVSHSFGHSPTLTEPVLVA